MSNTDPIPGSATTSSAHDDHGTVIGADASAINRGHEEDVDNVSAIWSIPIAVIIFIVLGLSVAAGMFIYFTNRAPDPLANPLAVQANQAGTNERLGRLGRAGQGTLLTDQPRLEGLQKREKDGFATTQLPLGEGNSPAIHPEDLRPDRQPLLQRSGWIEQGKVARIPIGQALDLAIKNQLFPVRKDPVKLKPSYLGANQANAGRGVNANPASPTSASHNKSH